MNKKIKRILSGALAAVMLIPMGLVSVYAEDEEAPQEPDTGTITISMTPNTNFEVTSVSGEGEEGKTKEVGNIELTKDKTSQKYDIEITNKEKNLGSITINVKEVETPGETKSGGEEIKTIILNESTKSDSNDIIKASVNDTWAKDDVRSCTLTIEGLKFDKNYNAIVTLGQDTREPYKASISDIRNATEEGAAEYYAGEEVTFKITPETDYQLSQLEITYEKDDTTKTTTMTSGGTWEDWTITWGSKSEPTTITGKIFGNITIKPAVEKSPVYYSLSIQTDEGLTVKSAPSSVLQGSSATVTIERDEGYLFEGCTVTAGKDYGSWSYGQANFIIAELRIPVTYDDYKISFTIPEVYSDMSFKFTAGYDEKNIPLKMNENSRIDIYTDSNSTVPSGSDVVFYISTTDEDYSVNRVTLKIGDESSTIYVANEYEIKVGDKTYAIDYVDNGVYALYVTDIKEPVTVTAYSIKHTTTVSRPMLSTLSSDNMEITKSVKSSYITAGENVNYYFTPNRNYQIDTITVQIGSQSTTVGAEKTSITVGDKTYKMSRNTSGEVTLYLTNIRQNVKVSAKAVFTINGVEQTTGVYVNAETRYAVMSGYSDGTFRPSDYMTKAEAVSLLYRMSAVVNGDSSSVYADVPQSMWCAREINIFANAGILDKSNLFYPDSYITRAQLVEMLYRMSGRPNVSQNVVYFNDVSNIAANNAINYAAEKGWISGYSDKTFRPYNYITRAEVASLICRIMERSYGSHLALYSDVPYMHWAFNYIQAISSYV